MKKYIVSSILLILPIISLIVLSVYFLGWASSYYEALHGIYGIEKSEYFTENFVQNLTYGILSLVSAIFLLVYFIYVTVRSLPVFQPLIANLRTKWEAFKAFRRLPKEERERIKRERKKTRLQKELDELN